MARILAPDDLQPGRFVTVFGPARVRPSRSAGRGRAMQVDLSQVIQMHIAAAAQSRPGVPLRVSAVDVPFVLVQPVLPGGRLGPPMPLDLRQVVLAGLSDAFVQAVLAMVPPAPADGDTDDDDDVSPDDGDGTLSADMGQPPCPGCDDDDADDLPGPGTVTTA